MENPQTRAEKKSPAEWAKEIPVTEQIARGEEALWLRGEKPPFAEAIQKSPLTASDVKDASARLSRFASYIKRVFPETEATGGILESPLVRAPRMQAALEEKYGFSIGGDLLIKLDSHLAVSGSIKARGGIYEVLCVAEKIARQEGGLQITDDYAVLAEQKYKDIFSKYEIAVGSTGNLGLSIGIMSAALGFKVTVHMSADAREWKKKKLRAVGATVVEYAEDYGVAVENGRKEAEKNPFCHFVDDENSRSLFLGYAVAAERLKKQLEAEGIYISEEKPLYAYLPCGVGGGPGGVAFGLKLAFGDAVHFFFAEPTEAPCMMLGMATGLHNAVSVRDFGLQNRTIADGLAVGRASGFVGKLTYDFTDGCYSVKDERMSSYLKLLFDTEGIALEPSALAGMHGPRMLALHGHAPKNAYHLIWATGGSMVPKEEYQKYYEQGEKAFFEF